MPSQAVDDLLWVVNSPSFVGGSQVAVTQTLDVADIDARHLESFLRVRPAHRVGRYFESLLHYWYEWLRGVEVVEAGLQIRDGKRTIGEIDFLYRNESEILVHCEASVKFFLHHQRDGLSDYPGPNASDDFERKAAKLFDQQLPLSEEHVPEVKLREAFVKGMVFYHWNAESPERRPERMAPDHLTGRWLRESELDVLAAQPGMVGLIAEKPHWLAPPHGLAVDVSTLATQLREHFNGERPHPVMLSLREQDAPGEAERVFAVSDRWPGSSTPS